MIVCVLRVCEKQKLIQNLECKAKEIRSMFKHTSTKTGLKYAFF